jgi:alkylation response protein AidB-like acyl-CoA dehydrogenase
MPAQGLRTAPIGELAFEDMFLPESNVGKPGLGLGIFNEAMAWKRSFATGIYVGMLERQLDEAIDYARHSEVHLRPSVGQQQARRDEAAAGNRPAAAVPGVLAQGRRPPDVDRSGSWPSSG